MSIHIPTIGVRANKKAQHPINFLKFKFKLDFSVFNTKRLVNSESLYQRQPSLFTKTPQRPLKKH